MIIPTILNFIVQKLYKYASDWSHAASHASFAHLSSHLSHVLGHLHSNLWVFLNIELHCFFKIVVFNTCFKENLVVHLCLIDHHCNHEFHLITSFWHFLCLHLAHIFHSQCFGGFKNVKSLLFLKFRCLWLLLLKFSLLCKHNKFSSLWVCCKSLMCHSKLLFTNSKCFNYFF